MRVTCRYALKCMLKNRVVGLNQVEHVLAERALLRLCEHPFICSLAATFQDAQYVYMLLEYVPGGELFSVLQVRFEAEPRRPLARPPLSPRSPPVLPLISTCPPLDLRLSSP